MNEKEKVIKEKAFDNFIDSNLYEDATTAIWQLVEGAYNDAWEKARAIPAETEK